MPIAPSPVRRPSRRHVAIPAKPALALLFVSVAFVIVVTVAWRQTRPTTPADLARAELAVQRELMLDRLHDYWTRGEFVQNPVPSGGPGHFIFDAQRRPCPLASIIIESGRRDLMEQAARENNGVKVADLRGGPILDWILLSGLTQEECILIQQPSRSGKEMARPEAETEQEKLRRTLEDVEVRLRRATDESLELAVTRLLRRG